MPKSLFKNIDRNYFEQTFVFKTVIFIYSNLNLAKLTESLELLLEQFPIRAQALYRTRLFKSTSRRDMKHMYT